MTPLYVRKVSLSEMVHIMTNAAVPKKKMTLAHKLTLAGVVVAFLSVAAGFLTFVLNNEGVRDAICRTNAGQWSGVSAYCGEGYVRITQEDAEAFLMHFYNQAGSGDSETAYALMTDARRSNITGQDFAEDWQDHAWAELVEIEPVHEGPLNTYDIVIRHYQGDDVTEGAGQFGSGQIGFKRSKATLKQVDGIIQLHRWSDAQWTLEGNEKIEKYPRWRLTQLHGTYESPILDDESTQRRTRNIFKEGGGLNVLCLLSLTDSVDSRITEDWARTPQGWIPADVLTPTEQEDDLEIPQCHARYGERHPLWQ